MYRRHLRMSLLGDMEANKNDSSVFLERISNVPVVYFAWNIALETYSNIKSSNSLIKVSLTSTEKVVETVCKPVVHKFRKQLKIADSLAVKGLDTLQGIIPTILQQPEKLYRHTKSKCDQAVNMGLKSYEMVKQVGASKVHDLVEMGSQKRAEFLSTPYGQICEVAVDNAFDIGEIYVDYYLPPLGDERPEKVFGDRSKLPVWERSEVISNRVKERLYKHSLLKIQKIKLRGKIIIGNVYSFNMYQYLEELLLRIHMRFYGGAIQAFSNLHELITLITSIYRNDIIMYK